jgi:molybdenum cofactor cytidylyltransferase
MKPAAHPALGVVILGAGASARMGRPKLLLPWRDTTVIGEIVSVWQKLGAAQIAVVMRPDDSPLAAELDRLDFPEADRIENPQPERGMFSSVLCAANWRGWRREISSWALVLGDQPHLPAGTLRLLLKCAAQNKDAICEPVSGGRGGHPVVFPRVQCEVNEPGLSLDLDTPEDYKRMQPS